MIVVKDSAQQHFRRLLDQQGIPGLGIRVRVLHPGTPKADCQIEFCESTDLNGDELALNCTDFVLYVDAAGVAYLAGAEIDYQTNATGGQLTIRAPKIKGSVPGADASLAERVQFLLDSEINPQVAAHGGRVSLVEVSAGSIVVLQFGGGCHGCGMVDVTLKQGIERTLRANLPEIAEVRDATDHTSGNAPYFRGKDGASALR